MNGNLTPHTSIDPHDEQAVENPRTNVHYTRNYRVSDWDHAKLSPSGLRNELYQPKLAQIRFDYDLHKKGSDQIAKLGV